MKTQKPIAPRGGPAFVSDDDAQEVAYEDKAESGSRNELAVEAVEVETGSGLVMIYGTPDDNWHVQIPLERHNNKIEKLMVNFKAGKKHFPHFVGHECTPDSTVISVKYEKMEPLITQVQFALK